MAASPPRPSSELEAPLLPGRADATAALAARRRDEFADGFYREFGELRVSALGAGTFLGEPTDAEDDAYAAALTAALERGVNVVDTAINYRCQRSERVVGRVLRALAARGTVPREAVMVCTKGGYVPLDGGAPEDRRAYAAYVKANWLDRGLLHPDELVAGGHAVAPAFLADQIDRSRANLGVETIDLYYVHNPEQQLDAVDAAELARRLRAAFAELEAQVERGAIAAYGVASWQGMRIPAQLDGHLSLEMAVQAAHEVAGDAHHLRAVQLPVNLAMPEALRLHTQSVQGKLRPVLEAAQALGLGVMASAPLQQGRLTRDLPPALGEMFPHLATNAQRALAFVTALPGVTTALVGARSAEHVRENMSVALRAT